MAIYNKNGGVSEIGKAFWKNATGAVQEISKVFYKDNVGVVSEVWSGALTVADLPNGTLIRGLNVRGYVVNWKKMPSAYGVVATDAVPVFAQTHWGEDKWYSSDNASIIYSTSDVHKLLNTIYTAFPTTFKALIKTVTLSDFSLSANLFLCSINDYDSNIGYNDIICNTWMRERETKPSLVAYVARIDSGRNVRDSKRMSTTSVARPVMFLYNTSKVNEVPNADGSYNLIF